MIHKGHQPGESPGRQQQRPQERLSVEPLQSPARSTAAGSALKHLGAGVAIVPFILSQSIIKPTGTLLWAFCAI